MGISLKEFVSNLVTSFPVEVLLEQAETVQSEIDAFIMPNLESTLEFAKTQKFKSDFATKLNAAFKRARLKRHPTFIHAVHASYSEIRDTQVLMINEIKRIKGNKRVFFTEHLKMKEVTIIRFEHDMLFINEFTSRMIALFWRAEKNLMDGKKETDGILRGEIEYFNKHLIAYIDRMSCYYFDSKTIKQKMENVPDLIFEQATADTVFALADPTALDPFISNLSAIELNPFFIIGKIRIENQEARYQAMLLDKQRVELRINSVRGNRQGQQDPNADKLLLALEARREKLQIKLNKMQEDV